MGFVPCVCGCRSVPPYLDLWKGTHLYTVRDKSIFAFALMLVVVAAAFETIDMHIMEQIATFLFPGELPESERRARSGLPGR
jgi:hypothetical protein